jgi:protein arginine kinase activator
MRTVIDGSAQEFHFCRECARKLREGFILPGLSAAIPLNELAQAVGDFLDGVASEASRGNPFPRKQKELLQEHEEEPPLVLRGRCPHCGCDEEWFSMTRLLGCPSCYTVFRKDILAYLKKEQKGDLHVGSSPPWDEGEEENLSVEIRKLQENLRRYVQEERYEEAADLRDRIRSLSALVESAGNE